MRNIMNSRRRTNRDIVNQPRHNDATNNRREYGFNNGYNRLQSIASHDNSNTVVGSSRPAENSAGTMSNNEGIPTTLQYNLFHTIVDVCANNLTTELYNNDYTEHISHHNNNSYYSTFEYESLSVRFFHNEHLNLQNINNVIESVIDNINDQELHTLLNYYQSDDLGETDEFMNNPRPNNNATDNIDEIIEQIHENVTHGEYIDYVAILKNHSCPILLNDFVNKDTISVFKLCNHAIHSSTYEKYVKTFTKCPLCNQKLF